MKKIIITSVFIVFSFYNLQAQCAPAITITGIYTTTLTQSSDWLVTSGVTTIPTSANVTLNASPSANGYILLDTGFETNPNTVFLAELVDCTLSTEDFTSNLLFKIFPNPVQDILTVHSKYDILSSEIIDINGREVQTNTLPNSTVSEVLIHVENLQSGLYFIKISTQKGSEIQKFIKK